MPVDPDPTVPAPVVVVNVQIPFWSMVILIIKFVLAAIPAAGIIFFLSAFFAAFMHNAFK